MIPKFRYLPLLAFVLLITGLQPAYAQDARAIIRQTIAVVDMQTILQDSKAAKSIQSQVEKLQQTYQTQIANEEKRLREAEQQLARQQTILAPEAYAEKRREFEQEIGKVQTDVNQKKQSLERAFAIGMKKLQDELVQIIGKMAEEKGYSIVLPRAQVLLVESAMDVTPAVLAQLDNRLPSISIEVPRN